MIVSREMVLCAAAQRVLASKLKDVRIGAETMVFTIELVMLEVVMGCRGNRSRTILEQLKETLPKPTQMQVQDDKRGVHDRVVEDTKRDDHWCQRCWRQMWRGRPTLSTS